MLPNLGQAERELSGVVRCSPNIRATRHPQHDIALKICLSTSKAKAIKMRHPKETQRPRNDAKARLADFNNFNLQIVIATIIFFIACLLLRVLGYSAFSL